METTTLTAAETTRTFTYIDMPESQLPHDLAQELHTSRTESYADAAEIVLITIYGPNGQVHPEAARALWLPMVGRLGVAWGADATWSTVSGLEQGIETWLNDPDGWDRGL